MTSDGSELALHPLATYKMFNSSRSYEAGSMLPLSYLCCYRSTIFDRGLPLLASIFLFLFSPTEVWHVGYRMPLATRSCHHSRATYHRYRAFTRQLASVLADIGRVDATGNGSDQEPNAPGYLQISTRKIA